MCACVCYIYGREISDFYTKIFFAMPMWLVGKKMKDGYIAISAAKNHFFIHFSNEDFVTRLAEMVPSCKKGKSMDKIKRQ